MKRTLAKAFLATAGGLAVTAAANRALEGMAPDLAPPLPGESNTYRWRGIDAGYTEAGDPADRDLVLLHGINAAGTSYEFEPVVSDLAEDYHVIAPDLPGYGRSERPPLVYSASLYESFVESFLDDVAEDPVVVASSLTGAYAVSAAERVGVERLVLVCPTDQSLPWRRLSLRTLLRSPLVGTALFNLIVSKPSIRRNMLDHGYYDAAALDDDELDYLWATGHQGGARYAPASFVSGYLDPEMDLSKAIRDLDVPVTLLWGREAETTPLSDGRTLADETDARLVVIDYAKLLPHAEHPEEFVDWLRGEVPAQA
ncbi:alpha/beta hydrolase [Halobacteriales archaeon QS_8_69_26]|nr:MAG: alpha/beta hydrolase [Halobacteriales archaeon QS_8_69_26]